MGSATLAVGHFYGQVRRRTEIGGISLAETRYAPGFEVPAHDHVHPFLGFVLTGSVVELAEGMPHRAMSPTGVFYHPAGMSHSAQIGRQGSARLFNVELGPVWAKRLAEYGLVAPAHPIGAGTGRLSWLIGHLYREYWTGDPAAGLAVDGLVLATLAELLRLPPARVRGQRPLWLDRVVELLRATFTDPPSVATMAGEAGVHPMHLTRACRQYLGCSVGELTRRFRIDEACRLIAKGEPLAQVAQATGFADQSHFSRTFSRVVGVSPGQYRRCLHGSGRPL